MTGGYSFPPTSEALWPSSDYHQVPTTLSEAGPGFWLLEDMGAVREPSYLPPCLLAAIIIPGDGHS